MRLLALDPASSCGWAYGNTHYVQPQFSGTWVLRKSGEDYARGVVAFRDLLELRISEGVDLIAYEMPIAGTRRSGAAKLMWLVGQIEELAARHGIQAVHWYPVTIKKHATGRPDAQKHDMIHAAIAAGAVLESRKSDDEADAYWVWRLARESITNGNTAAHSERRPKRQDGIDRRSGVANGRKSRADTRKAHPSSKERAQRRRRKKSVRKHKR